MQKVEKILDIRERFFDVRTTISLGAAWRTIVRSRRDDIDTAVEFSQYAGAPINHGHLV